MVGIPADLVQRLRETLIRCGPFRNDRELRSVFVDQRISLWRDALPQAASRSERANLVIEHLLNHYNEDDENALVLFLRVTSEFTTPGDSCHHQLTQLADELKNQLETTPQSLHTQVRDRGQVKESLSAQLISPKITDITGEQKRLLIQALLNCPTINDREARDTVVAELPDAIRTSIRRHATDRVDVSNIVTMCLNHAAGLEQLIEIVRFYEGDSLAMQEVDKLFREFTASSRNRVEEFDTLWGRLRKAAGYGR